MGCPSWSCLAELDEMAAALSDSDRLTMYTDACAQGILEVKDSYDETETTSKAKATVDVGSEHVAADATLPTVSA